MKTLYINGKYLSQPTTGVQRYAAGVVNGLDAALAEGRIDPGKYSIRVIVPRTERQIPLFQAIKVVHSRFSGRLWEQVELPFLSRGEVLFSPFAAAPLLKRHHAVTIHDAGAAAAPGQYSRAFRMWCSLAYRWFGKTGSRVFTVSNFSRNELEQYFGISQARIVVVPPACDHLTRIPPALEILDQFGLEPGKFVLGVSSRSPIKNFSGLALAVHALNRPELKLAVAGRRHPKLFREQASDTESSIIWLDYVSDTQLRALYEAAALFVYPSFYEGFGIPPIEAMSCGCPVVAAAASSLPESCGDAALFCDPSNPADIAQKIGEILDQPELAESFRTRGRAQAARYTSERTASLIWSQILPLLG